MILKCIKRGDDVYLYIQKSTYLSGKVSSINVMNCGKISALKEKFEDPIAHFSELAKKMTKEEQLAKENSIISIDYSPSRLMAPDQQNAFFAGHLYLNPIYSALNLPAFCKMVAKEHKFKFDFNSILLYLISSTFISPSSKLGVFDKKEQFIDSPEFSIEHLYRSLEYIAKHNELLQNHLYNSSKSIVKRDTNILFYDCTNYFFEIDDEDQEEVDEETGEITKGKRSYGHCKRNSKLPITQLGLFMDGNGLPLAFTTFPGGASEQKTLKPLEKRIIKDFKLSKFIVCTDAGLTSYTNKKYNTGGERAYVTTQSLKLLSRNAQKKNNDSSQKTKKTEKQLIAEWALDKKGWCYRTYDKKTRSWTIHSNIDLSKISEEDWQNIFLKTIFYKDRIYKYKCEIDNDDAKENGDVTEGNEGNKKKSNAKKEVIIEERFVVTFCYKYKLRPQKSREKEINRLRKLLKSPKAVLKEQFGRGARFIKEECFNSNGEIIDNKVLTIDKDYIENESKYDGFYCVTTNLFSETHGDAYKIVEINSRRWEIEECFKIMRQMFKTRPIYLRREDRIDAHLTVNFISLLIFRILEAKLNTDGEHYTYQEIIEELRKISLANVKNKGFMPVFKRTPIIDKLTEATKVELRNEILTHKMLNEQIRKSKQ